MVVSDAEYARNIQRIIQAKVRYNVNDFEKVFELLSNTNNDLLRIIGSSMFYKFAIHSQEVMAMIQQSDDVIKVVVLLYG